LPFDFCIHAKAYPTLQCKGRKFAFQWDEGPDRKSNKRHNHNHPAAPQNARLHRAKMNGHQWNFVRSLVLLIGYDFSVKDCEAFWRKLSLLRCCTVQ
jgi:hypothetical protein